MFAWWNDRKEEQPKLVPSHDQWLKGEGEGEGEGGFGTGRINLGELEVVMVRDFKYVATHKPKNGWPVSYYKPLSIPDDGFFSFGHYAQPTRSINQQHRKESYVLVARDISSSTSHPPPLEPPLSYQLISSCENRAFLWFPCPPKGYQALGYVATTSHICPKLDEVMCVRDDLTECCRLGYEDILGGSDFTIFNTGGMFPKAVPVATLFSTSYAFLPGVDKRCLRNLNPTHAAMPNPEQQEALIDHYRPTIYSDPHKVYIPSSVPWFFNNGSLLLKRDVFNRISIDPCLSQPKNYKGQFWLHFNPQDAHGDLKSAQTYIHVKPAFGGTFTDIDMWIFFSFNGPVSFTFAKLLKMDVQVNQRAAGWEHFTLRLNNFDGELWSMYFSMNSHCSHLEFINENKPIFYAAKAGFTTFPTAGTGLKFGVDRSHWFIDTSNWLPHMRDWGPTLMYDAWSELKKEQRLIHLFSHGTSQQKEKHS